MKEQTNHPTKRAPLEPVHPELDDPAWRAALRDAVRGNEKAMQIWAQCRTGKGDPDLFVFCSDGIANLYGLLIGGHPDDVAADGWDFDSAFTLYTEDGIFIVKGWLTTDLVTYREAGTTGYQGEG